MTLNNYIMNKILRTKDFIQTLLRLRRIKKIKEEEERIRGMFHFVIDNNEVYIMNKSTIVYKCDKSLPLSESLKIMEKYIAITTEFDDRKFGWE